MHKLLRSELWLPLPVKDKPILPQLPPCQAIAPFILWPLLRQRQPTSYKLGQVTDSDFFSAFIRGSLERVDQQGGSPNMLLTACLEGQPDFQKGATPTPQSQALNRQRPHEGAARPATVAKGPAVFRWFTARPKKANHLECGAHRPYERNLHGSGCEFSQPLTGCPIDGNSQVGVASIRIYHVRRLVLARTIQPTSNWVEV